MQSIQHRNASFDLVTQNEICKPCCELFNVPVKRLLTRQMPFRSILSKRRQRSLNLGYWHQKSRWRNGTMSQMKNDNYLILWRIAPFRLTYLMALFVWSAADNVKEVLTTWEDGCRECHLCSTTWLKLLICYQNGCRTTILFTDRTIN